MCVEKADRLLKESEEEEEVEDGQMCVEKADRLLEER